LSFGGLFNYITKKVAKENSLKENKVLSIIAVSMVAIGYIKLMLG